MRSGDLVTRRTRLFVGSDQMRLAYLLNDLQDASQTRVVQHLKINAPLKMFKPFKPPLLQSSDKQPLGNSHKSKLEPEFQPRPHKRRKLLVHYVEDSPPKTLPTASAAVNAPRKPLLMIKNPTETNKSVEVATVASDCPEGYYMVLWYVRCRSSIYDS
jgi:hypothetical protein